jgi:hypothetical protein
MSAHLLAIENLWLVAALGLFSFLLVVLVEAIIMLLFRINSFGRCFRDSFMANVGTLLLGILLFLVFNKMEFEGLTELAELGAFFLIASLFEGWIVKLLNTNGPWSKVLAASFIMNLLTFGASYLFFLMYIF